MSEQLWLGKIDESEVILKDIDVSKIKLQYQIDKLINYFERNRTRIPCYALRNKLGLRNSSNKGEKLNHILVSERQKHNGMSWSKEGSINLSTLKALDKNMEIDNWYDRNEICFKFVA